MKVLVALGLAVLAGLQQANPVFRSSTDLVVLDVVVTDSSGTVVTSLTPADFVVTTKKGARSITSLEFVSTRLPGAPPELILPEPGLAPSVASTNAGKPLGRAFLLAIDVGEIRAGEGRIAMQQVAAFVNALPPQDLAGLVILPAGTPRVELTTDRKVIRETLAMTVGASDEYRSCAVTFGEAAGIAMGDRSARSAYGDRLVKAHCPPSGLPIDVAIAQYRMQTRSKLDTLGALAGRMARLDGQKTIILVSEGLFTDRETQADIARFAARAEASRVRLYSLHLDTPGTEAAYAVGVSTHNLDDHLGFNAMADVATATGGTALRVIARATGPLDRVDREASGYYLISVETDPSERDGKSVEMKIRVKTRGLDVRARPAFVHAPSPALKANAPTATPSELKTAIGETLRWPVDEAAFRIDLDIVRLPVVGQGTRTLMLAEFDKPPAALGFEITDPKGAVVADTFESPVNADTADGRRALYVGSVSLAPGDYRLKMAVISRDGRRGGVTHAFTVDPQSAEGLRISDILLGAENSSPWRPIARVAAGQQRIGIRVDFTAGTIETLAAVTAHLRVGRMGQPGWLAEADLPISQVEAEPLSLSARGAVNLAALPKGSYVLKVELRSGDAIVASTAKIVRVN